MGAPDIGGPGGTAVTGLENGQGYAGRVKFGIPEWGSPLPGMAPAPLQKPASRLYLDWVLPMHGANCSCNAPSKSWPFKGFMCSCANGPCQLP